jgi:hypothetical protein
MLIKGFIGAGFATLLVAVVFGVPIFHDITVLNSLKQKFFDERDAIEKAANQNA